MSIDDISEMSEQNLSYSFFQRMRNSALLSSERFTTVNSLFPDDLGRYCDLMFDVNVESLCNLNKTDESPESEVPYPLYENFTVDALIILYEQHPRSRDTYPEDMFPLHESLI